VREYWLRQWAEVDSHVEPLAFRERPDGELEVRVRQTGQDRAGQVVFDGEVRHVYAFRDELVERMTIEE
jgi:hypothetical protein